MSNPTIAEVEEAQRNLERGAEYNYGGDDFLRRLYAAYIANVAELAAKEPKLEWELRNYEDIALSATSDGGKLYEISYWHSSDQWDADIFVDYKKTGDLYQGNSLTAAMAACETAEREASDAD